MKYLLLILLMLPASAMAESNDRCSELTVREGDTGPVAKSSPTQIELLTQMVESQQKMIQTLIDAVQAQDARIKALEEKVKAKDWPPVNVRTPVSHGCYQWLSDGGREAIPCPTGENK